MDKFIALVVSGGVSGAIYSLLASGLVLTYATSGVFNFAHGAVAFSTAFLFYELNTGLGWPVWAAALVSIMVFAPMLGVLMDRIIFRSLRTAEQSTKVVATVGLLVAIPAVTLFVTETLINTFHWKIPGPDNIFSPPGLGPVPKKNWKPVGNIRIDSNQVIILVAAVVAAVVLWIVVRRTRIGLQMRASVERPDLAEARGIDTNRASAFSWALSFMLAGLAGVVGAPLFSLTPANYTVILFLSATAAVIGRLRSIPMAFVGGIVLGLAQSLFAGYATFAESITGFSTSVPFIVLLIGLIVLGRERARIAGQVAEVAAQPDYHADLPRWRRLLPWVVAIAAFTVYLLFIADEFWRGLLVKGLAYSLIFLSFVVVTGIGGMVSLAQATFVTMASLTTGLLMSHGWPFLPAAIAGVLAAAVVGLIVALPSVRLGGLALALSSLALALLGEKVLFAWKAFANSNYGWKVPKPKLGPIDMHGQRTLGIVLMIVVGLVVLVIHNLVRSASGREIAAVRTAPPAASAVGLSLVRGKLWIFALSAGVAGLGGVMIGVYNGSVTNASFPAGVGLAWLAIVVLFGIRKPSGAVIAGIVFSISPQVIGWVTDSNRIADILFGLGAVQLAKTPDGVLSNFSRQGFERRAKRRLRRKTLVEPAASDVQPADAHPGGVSAFAVGSDVGADAVLDLAGVIGGYGPVEVLHGIDVKIAPGTITALLGSNGAGKSTLCLMAAGGLPAASGVIRLTGVDVTKSLGHRRARHGVAYAPESRGVFPGLSVEENLTLVLAKAADRNIVYERFPVLGERRKLAAGSLSGGEQQMLALAPLVVHPPKVLIADEPSLGLAPRIVEQVMALLVEMRNHGTAVLVVEEKATHVLPVADQVAFLELGRVTWSGPAADVDADALAASYLHGGPA
ncbi:MAG: ATP-binding cassette domain-containing protein [Ilumatobacteraceae bacterium]